MIASRRYRGIQGFVLVGRDRSIFCIRKWPSGFSTSFWYFYWLAYLSGFALACFIVFLLVIGRQFDYRQVLRTGFIAHATV